MDLQVILQVAEEVLALKPDGFDGNPNGYDPAILGITDDGQLVYSKIFFLIFKLKYFLWTYNNHVSIFVNAQLSNVKSVGQFISKKPFILNGYQNYKVLLRISQYLFLSTCV